MSKENETKCLCERSRRLERSLGVLRMSWDDLHRLIVYAQSVSTRIKEMVGVIDGVDVNSSKKGLVDYYWLFYSLLAIATLGN